MKKLFRNALIVASAGAMLGGLNSCKDTDEDMKYEIEAELNSKIDNAQALIDQLKADLAKIKSCECDNTTLLARVSALETKLAALDGVPAKITSLQGDIDDLAKDLKDNYATKAELQAVADDLQALSTKIDLLAEKLAKLVTSVLVQGTLNPSFGYVALPTNVRTNILSAYYGESGFDVTFPSVQTAPNVANSDVFTQADIALLKATGLADVVTIENGQVLVEENEGNAGKVYLTVNPTAVDFTGLNFSLVNSLDEESGIKLGALTPSKDKLTFGFSGTRGEASNGFYEAPATLTAENIDKVKISIDSNLKSAVKEVYKSKSSASITNLATAIYQQLTGVTDANAVKASWTAGDESNSVYSQYGIAAIAYSPLSYAFNPSLSLNLSKIPEIPSLGDLSFNLDIKVPEFNFDLSGLDIDIKLNIDNISTPNIDLSGSSFVVASFTYDSPVMEYDATYDQIVVKKDANNNVVYETKQGETKVDLSNFTGDLAKQIGDAITNQMTSVLDGMSENLNKQIKEQVINKLASTIQDQIATTMNNTLNGMMGNLNSQINNMLGSYLGTINTYLSKLQTVADRVNAIIEQLNGGLNINAILTPTLVYENNSGALSRLSSAIGSPTIFKIGSGDAITLNPTSLSAEMIAPAYKKFVGVTNVYSNSDSSKTAQGNDEGCVAAAKKANSAEYMNEVISGGRYGVPFVGTAGYTYEIAYAAVDFHGQVSIQKFYVKVID